MSLRHLAREIVVQALFTWDFYEKDSSKIDEYFSFSLSERNKLHDVDFPKELCNGIIRKVDVLDEIITKAAPAWPIDRIAPVDRNILRMGIFEMLFSERGDVPPRVAINEAIELAKSYGGPNSYKFVSGVLGSIYEASDLKQKDMEQKKKEQDPANFPIESKAGAVVFSVDKDGETKYAFVHDIFGRWTLSKGSVEEGENLQEAAIREIKEEIGIDIEIREEIGKNEYLANSKEHGKIRRQVVYFLGEAKYKELKLEEDNGGLTDAKWFTEAEVAEINTYDDIKPLITKGIELRRKLSS